MTSPFAIPTLRSARLTLRAFCARDLPAYAALLGDPDVARFLGTGQARNEAESWEAMARALGHWALRGYGLFALEHAGDCIGHAGILHPPSWPQPELAYAVAPAAQGRGLATEAASAVRAWARSALGISDLVSFIRASNAASIAVARKLGARHEGEVPLLGAPAQVWRHGSLSALPPPIDASTVIHVPVLETPRLRLRRFVFADHAELCVIHADPAVMRYLGDGQPRDGALTWSQMAMWTGSFGLHAGGYWAITRRSDGALLGRCGINAQPAWPEPELAYTLARAHWGQGLAREAAASVRDWAWQEMAPSSLVSFVKIGNQASGRVATKLGARLTGTLVFEGKPTERWEYPRP